MMMDNDNYDDGDNYDGMMLMMSHTMSGTGTTLVVVVAVWRKRLEALKRFRML